MKIVITTESEIWKTRDDYHVLTFAEIGFSPLSIHTMSMKIDRECVEAFSDEVNESGRTGSLHPHAAISAVPRALIRCEIGSPDLQRSIEEFLQANRRIIKARKIICDFGTPSVPEHVIAAIADAMCCKDASFIEKVVIVV